MRLIDADAMKEHVKRFTSVFAKYDWREICEMLNDAPTVDAVEVVRCKDCTSNENGFCIDYGIHMDDNEFCSGGERREDGKID